MWYMKMLSEACAELKRAGKCDESCLVDGVRRGWCGRCVCPWNGRAGGEVQEPDGSECTIKATRTDAGVSYHVSFSGPDSLRMQLMLADFIGWRAARERRLHVGMPDDAPDGGRADG